MADNGRKRAPKALGTGILRRAQLPATGIERLRRPHVEEKEIDDDENSGEEYDDDDEVSLDGNVPLNLETLLRDWKKFDSAKTTTQQRRKIAISHGFQNITEFREYMRQQEIVETPPAPSPRLVHPCSSRPKEMSASELRLDKLEETFSLCSERIDR